MSDKATHTDSGMPQQRPGQLLKAAREKLGLAPKEIASQLNLQAEIIDAVEKDDDTRLPTPTYVRGYIRSYARIVHLDGDMLIRLYEQDAAAPPEIIPDIRKHSQFSSNDKPVKAVTYLITFIMALLLLAWLQSNYIVNQNTDAKTAPETPAADNGQRDSGTVTPGHETTATATGLETYNDTRDTAPAPAGSAELPNQIISTIELPRALTMDSSVNTAPVPPETSAPDSNTPQEDRVSFKLIKSSWIEVYDANNNKLFLGMAKAGEEVNLTGTAPFNVLLGYSPAVQVTFNGEPFNAEPFSNAGIARFKLEAQEHAE